MSTLQQFALGEPIATMIEKLNTLVVMVISILYM